jgi:hypothetical protein
VGDGTFGRPTWWRGVALTAGPVGVAVAVLVAAAVALGVGVGVAESPGSSSVVQAPKSKTPAKISAVASRARIPSLLRRPEGSFRLSLSRRPPPS